MTQIEFQNKLKETLRINSEAIIYYSETKAELRFELRNNIDVIETFGHGKWRAIYYVGTIDEIERIADNYYWKDATIKTL